MEYVLGIDGGGTKTTAALADIQGNIAAIATVGPANLNSVSESELKAALHEMVSMLLEQLPGGEHRVLSVFAGMAGAGNAANLRKLESLLAATVSAHFSNPIDCPVQVEQDTVNALYTGTFGRPGIVHISGTGSITYGVNERSEHARAGGWGYLLGDEGSGYDIGRQGIMAALQAYDERGPATVLSTLLAEFFQAEDPQEWIHSIYRSQSPKNRIASVTPIVFQAYHQGDHLAIEIVRKAVRDIRHSIFTIYKKLFSHTRTLLSNSSLMSSQDRLQPANKVDVVLCGGVFAKEKVMSMLLKEYFNEVSQLHVIVPTLPPVGGSLIGAYKLLDRQPDEQVITRMNFTI